MVDKLVKMDYEHGKIVVMRTSIAQDGSPFEQQVELDLPDSRLDKELLRKVKHGDDGKLYETEEVIETPILKGNKKEEV